MEPDSNLRFHGTYVKLDADSRVKGKGGAEKMEEKKIMRIRTRESSVRHHPSRTMAGTTLA